MVPFYFSRKKDEFAPDGGSRYQRHTSVSAYITQVLISLQTPHLSAVRTMSRSSSMSMYQLTHLSPNVPYLTPSYSSVLSVRDQAFLAVTNPVFTGRGFRVQSPTTGITYRYMHTAECTVAVGLPDRAETTMTPPSLPSPVLPTWEQ